MCIILEWKFHIVYDVNVKRCFKVVIVKFLFIETANSTKMSELPTLRIVRKDQLESVIKRSIRSDQPFYIGVAGNPDDDSTAVGALSYRERNGHHADERAGQMGYSLATRTCTWPLKKVNACQLERGLIEKYRTKNRRLCLNKKSGEYDCLSFKKGIVYVRTYELE